MGVLPLQLDEGTTFGQLGIDGTEVFGVGGLAGADPRSLIGAALTLTVGDAEVPVTVRIDTPTEAAYYEHGGILQYVLRQHLAPAPTSDPWLTGGG
jgi:aconitate hydratase